VVVDAYAQLAAEGYLTLRRGARGPAVTDADLGYGDPRGVIALRSALAAYLGRVRGVVADPDRVIVTSGYTQGLGLVCRALAMSGARRVALEDPSNPEDAMVAARAGLEPVRVGVDAGGIRLDELPQADVGAVVLTPARQHPTGVVPPSLLEAVTHEKLLADRGTARIEQHAFADFLDRGELDRHLRRMRARYRSGRDALVEALAQ
jgi:DNA-binding transcriptional MocR family regulator